jgi:hypothetical protein
MKETENWFEDWMKFMPCSQKFSCILMFSKSSMQMRDLLALSIQFFPYYW